MYIHEFQQNCTVLLLCAMSTKCFYMRHLMSLTAMLIEEIRYFDENNPSFHLLITARVRIMLLSQFSVFFQNIIIFRSTTIRRQIGLSPVSTTRVDGPSTRVVETGLQYQLKLQHQRKDGLHVGQYQRYKYKYKYKWGFVERGLQIVQGR